MSLEVQGKITKFLEVQSGTAASGNEWKKQSFLIETEEQYNNLYCFEVFGAEKVDNLEKFNKVGDDVSVQFNVNTNEWKGKYFTSLSAWRIEKVDSSSDSPEPEPVPASTDSNGDLPFQMKIGIKPLSVNQCWQGRRFKTKKYKSYERELLAKLPNLSVSNGLLDISVVFGYSSKLSDIDNGLKPLLDILQKKYNFDDRQIYHLDVTKEIVKKGNEYIKIEINEYNDIPQKR